MRTLRGRSQRKKENLKYVVCSMYSNTTTPAPPSPRLTNTAPVDLDLAPAPVAAVVVAAGLAEALLELLVPAGRSRALRGLPDRSTRVYQLTSMLMDSKNFGRQLVHYHLRESRLATEASSWAGVWYASLHLVRSIRSPISSMLETMGIPAWLTPCCGLIAEAPTRQAEPGLEKMPINQTTTNRR